MSLLPHMLRLGLAGGLDQGGELAGIIGLTVAMTLISTSLAALAGFSGRRCPGGPLFSGQTAAAPADPDPDEPAAGSRRISCFSGLVAPGTFGQHESAFFIAGDGHRAVYPDFSDHCQPDPDDRRIAATADQGNAGQPGTAGLAASGCWCSGKPGAAC